METNICDSRVFKVENYKYIDDPYNLIIDCIAVMIGECRIERKQVANLILKVLLKKDFKRFLFEDKKLYPYDRNDSRVRAWKKNILAKGLCERCGIVENLEAHHIVHWSDYPMGRIDVQNGECLCCECHANEHIGELPYSMMISNARKKK